MQPLFALNFTLMEALVGCFPEEHQFGLNKGFMTFEGNEIIIGNVMITANGKMDDTHMVSWTRKDVQSFVCTEKTFDLRTLEMTKVPVVRTRTVKECTHKWGTKALDLLCSGGTCELTDNMMKASYSLVQFIKLTTQFGLNGEDIEREYRVLGFTLPKGLKIIKTHSNRGCVLELTDEITSERVGFTFEELARRL